MDLTRARADKPVEWNGGQIGSILADHFSSATDLVIRNATVTGLVNLWSAWVRGDVRLVRQPTVAAVRAGDPGRSHAGGRHIFMNGEGFHALGEVCLRAPCIEGQLNCRRASFNNPSGYSVSADHIIVGGDVLLEEGFCADGEVCVQWARVGRLRATGSSFASAATYALHADTLHADGGADPNLRPFRFPAAYPAHQIGASPVGTIITSQRSSSQAKAAPIGTCTRASPACSPNRVGRLVCLSYPRRYTFNYNPNGRPAPQVIARVSTIVTVIPFCGEGWGKPRQTYQGRLCGPPTY